MAELDLEEILRAVFDKTQRQRRNPARHPATTESALDEMPIAITGSTVPRLLYPQWADWRLGDEFEDHFNNTTASDVTLQSHTTDSGHKWHVSGGAMSVSTGDYAFAGASAVYNAASRTADLRMSCTVIAGAGSGMGLFIRQTTGTNFWAFYSINSDYRLFTGDAGGYYIASGLGTPANGDVMEIEAIGNTIQVSVNGTVLYVVDDDYNSTETLAGIVLSSTSRIKDFHAWNIVGTSLNFATDPGHTIWGGPEQWVAGTELGTAAMSGTATLTAEGDVTETQGAAATLSGTASVTPLGVIK